MQIGRKMTDLEAFEVLSVILEHPVYVYRLVKPFDKRRKLNLVFTISGVEAVGIDDE